AKADQLPVVFAGDGIDVALPEEADVVRILELLDRSWVASQTPIVKLDRALVLPATTDQLLFTIAFDLRADRRQRRREGDHDKRAHQKDRYQDISVFASAFPRLALSFHSRLTSQVSRLTLR